MSALRRIVITVFLVVGLIKSVYGEDIIICISGDTSNISETTFGVGQETTEDTASRKTLPNDSYGPTDLARWLSDNFGRVQIDTNVTVRVTVTSECSQCIRITTERRSGDATLFINGQPVGNSVTSIGSLKIWVEVGELSSGNCPTPPQISPLLYPLDNCDESETNSIETDELSDSIQVENLMDGNCQSLIISQPTLSTGDSNAISLPSGNSLKSVSLAPPYNSSNVQISEAGAVINLTPLFGRGKTMNINFELNSPAEPNTVISVTCPCPLDVKLSSFKATLEAAKEQVALTWEILEGNNAYLNIWGAQLEANAFKNVTQFNTQPIPIDETASLMNFSLNTSQLNPGATYFALESVSYEGECVTYCDNIDAVVLGPVEVDLESVKNLCKQEMKRQIAVFGNTGSCVK